MFELAEFLEIDYDKVLAESFAFSFLNKDLKRNNFSAENRGFYKPINEFVIELYNMLKDSTDVDKVLSVETQKGITSKYSYIEDVKDFMYPIKELPLLIKS